MTKRKKHESEEPTSAEVAQDVAVGAPAAPESEDIPIRLGPAWIGTSPGADSTREAIQSVRARIPWLGKPSAPSGLPPIVPCATCGNPVAPGLACTVDGQISPLDPERPS